MCETHTVNAQKDVRGVLLIEMQILQELSGTDGLISRNGFGTWDVVFWFGVRDEESLHNRLGGTISPFGDPFERNRRFLTQWM